MPYTVSEILNIAENMVTTEDLSGETGARREPQFYRDSSTTALDMDTSNLLLGAGVTVITHPLLYVKLLIQVLAISTMVRSKVKQTIPADDVSNRDDLKTSLRKVVKV
ncbi:unnamed protein product, partial [Coregonus sp. 'balchen']